MVVEYMFIKILHSNILKLICAKGNFCILRYLESRKLAQFKQELQIMNILWSDSKIWKVSKPRKIKREKAKPLCKDGTSVDPLWEPN